MLAITLTFTVISSVAFLLIGSIIGYIFKEYSYDQASRYIPTHPEMFDENGHLIPDEVLCSYDSTTLKPSMMRRLNNLH